MPTASTTATKAKPRFNQARTTKIAHRFSGGGYFLKALPYAQNRRELPNGEKPDQPPPGQPHPPFWA
jgi:hypothetical protein